MNRDKTLDIVKGIGIILMVVGHSGAPAYVHDVIYTFHMPLFFIASGWFFSERNLDDTKGFAMRKIKSIYFPYWKWCVIFLLLHNVFYSVGIINDIYGFNGKANYWLEVKDMALHAADFSIRMTGYDSMLGAYWFIRSLLWGSLLLCFFSAQIKKTTKLRQSTCIISVSIVFCIMGGAISLFNIHIPFWPQGGYREMMAVFFIGMGFMLRKMEWWKSNYMMVLFLIIIPLSLQIEPTSLRANNQTFVMWMLIPFTGLAGYALVYKFSSVVAQSKGKIANCLSYIGRQSFYIMTFHFLMFKPASLLKTYIYGMDWKMIGCHPVIPPEGDNWYWIVYTVTSLILSLGMARIIESIPSPKLNINMIRK